MRGLESERRKWEGALTMTILALADDSVRLESTPFDQSRALAVGLLKFQSSAVANNL